MAKLRERYAQALYDLSIENDNIKKTLREATLVNNALNEEEVQFFLLHPHVSDSEKHQLFESTFSEHIESFLLNFLHLMIDKNREGLIIPTLTELITRIKRQLNQTEATVVSAKELTEKQVEAIRELLTKKTQMDIEFHLKVDPDVIGGFYILIDGFVFDGTVRTQLIKMKEKLKREGVAHVS
ncbi:F0F1 ATP synthase subunit delta [Alkalibacterium sp. s-m-22]|uniref:ATP synthase subunit delta n=1 Tax=Alkalibacterium indicireducens TaxID=398758 RepID=A0ABN1B6K8_9LACT